MRYLLDTNILIYSTQEDCPEHKKTHKYLKSLIEKNTSICLSWSIIYEYLRVSTHHKVFPNPFSIDEAWSNINTLISLSNVSILVPGEHHATYLKEILERYKSKASGNILHDFHNVALMLEYGVKEIISADNDFRMFEFLTVQNPCISES